MNIFLIVFFYIEFFNILSALITRLCMLGKSEKIYEEQDNDSNKLAFCIAGLLNQPERAFEHIDIPGYKKVYVKFSPIGYSGVTLGKIINALHQITIRYYHEDIILGISIGSLAALNAKMDQTILINPCCDAKMLKKSLYWLIKIFSPIAEIISLALGWLSFIPIIPAQEGYYSIALLVDQLFNMGYGSILNKLSTRSKVIKNKENIKAMKRYTKPTCEILEISPSTILEGSIWVGGNDETIENTDGQLSNEHRTDWDNIWENI